MTVLELGFFALGAVITEVFIGVALIIHDVNARFTRED